VVIENRAPRLQDDGAWRRAGCGQHDKGSGVTSALTAALKNALLLGKALSSGPLSSSAWRGSGG